MAVTQALAGFTLAEADVLCYTIRKKIREKLDAQKTKFMAGAHRSGVPMDVIEKVWANFEPFARYGFNRAHAAIYGMIAYHTAYLKANYTPEYMTAVLSTEMGTPERVAIAVAECRRMGIEVLPPDINASELGFTVDGSTIRFGLGAVKNVGEAAVLAVLEARASAGPFRSLEDLCQRTDLQRINKRVLESLIRCGACDAFGARLAQLAQLDAVLATAQREQRDRELGQVGLFAELMGASAAGRIEGGEAPRRELLGWEKELLGIYLSEHPLQDAIARHPDVAVTYLAELREAGDDLVTVACVVTNARKHVTKNKQLMLFAQVEDLTGAVEVTVFPRTYEATHAVWNTDEILLVLARVEQRDEAPQLLAEHAVRFDDAGIREMRAKAEERRSFAARRQRYGTGRGDGNGRGNGGGRANGDGAGRAVVPEPQVTGPAPKILVRSHDVPEILVRFRVALDYDRSIALFQRIQVVLGAHPGVSPVALELPRADGATRRIPTSFRARASDELSAAIQREVGDVVEVVVGSG
jgi:DNA polymerase-3 subunit alpha